jgi:hypothetical protein
MGMSRGDSSGQLERTLTQVPQIWQVLKDSIPGIKIHDPRSKIENKKLEKNGNKINKYDEGREGKMCVEGGHCSVAFISVFNLVQYTTVLCCTI